MVNVLGWGTGSMLVWSACLHRLPYNRSVYLSLLQLCVLMLQNGPVISSMHRHFGAKLDVRTVHPCQMHHVHCLQIATCQSFRMACGLRAGSSA